MLTATAEEKLLLKALSGLAVPCDDMAMKLMVLKPGSCTISGIFTLMFAITLSAMPNTTARTRKCSQRTTASGGFSSRRPKSFRYFSSALYLTWSSAALGVRLRIGGTWRA